MSKFNISLLLDRLEEWHNWASDTKVVWFPFEQLRVPKDQTLSWGKRLIMTFCFASLTTLLVMLKIFLVEGKLDLQVVCRILLQIHLLFFVWFNTATAFFWNRRARRLQRINCKI